MDRRNNARHAFNARRNAWAHKLAEADRREALDRAEREDSAMVRDWLARFQAARNAACTGSM